MEGPKIDLSGNQSPKEAAQMGRRILFPKKGEMHKAAYPNAPHANRLSAVLPKMAEVKTDENSSPSLESPA